MKFIELRQAALAGPQRILVNAEAIAYIQELSPEQSLGWPAVEDSARSLVHLSDLLQPVAVLESPEEIAARARKTTAPSRAPRDPAPRKAPASRKPRNRDA